MSKIERVSSMITGVPCVIMYNGKIKNCKVKENLEGKKFIQFNGHIYHEDELPFGEEITI